MNVITVPLSGRLLASQLAAYGLAAAIERADAAVWVGHGPNAVDLTPLVYTGLTQPEVIEAIRASAEECESAVEADIVPGATGNNRIPVIRARATDLEQAVTALVKREALLDELASVDAVLAERLLAGLGSPAPWICDQGSRDKRLPARGATRLDGVAYNIGSDIVRGALRRVLVAAKEVTTIDQDASSVGMGSDAAERFGWSPAGTSLELAWQWLAALGLTLLPVGLVAQDRARTPAFWDQRARREGQDRGITLPILTNAVSIARLRALLQLEELASYSTTPAARKRLKALGVSALAMFDVREASSGTMVQFSFNPAKSA